MHESDLGRRQPEPSRTTTPESQSCLSIS